MKKITFFCAFWCFILSMVTHAQQETLASIPYGNSTVKTISTTGPQNMALSTIYDTSHTSGNGVEITPVANGPAVSMGDAIVLAGTARFVKSITIDLFNIASAAPFDLTISMYTDCTAAGTAAGPCGNGAGVLIPGSVLTQTVTPGPLGFFYQHTFNYTSLNLSSEVDNTITVMINASRSDVFWRYGDTVTVGAQPAGEPALSVSTRCGSAANNNGCARNFGIQNNFTMTIVADSNQGNITQCSIDPPLPLGPGSGVTTLTTINVAQTGVIGTNTGNYVIDEIVADLQHTWASDLEIVLISPSGTQVALSTDNGGSTGLDVQSILRFRDDSANSVSAWTGGAPLANYRAEGGATAHPVGAGAGPGVDLNTVLVGQSVNGIWTLRLYDDAGGDGGTIFDFCINLTEITQIGAVPNIVCPLDIVINNETGTCGAQVFFNNATAIDPEDGLIPVAQTMGPGTGSIFPIGDTIIEFSATDSDGNTSTCQFTITVEDVDNPTAVCQAITVVLDGTGNVMINAADLDGGSTDLCTGVNFSFDMAGTVTTMNLDCSNLGENTITLYVTDGGGNVVSCDAIVTVEDNEAPVIVCASAGGLTTVSEDFEGGLPAGWSAVSNTGPCDWQVGSLPWSAYQTGSQAMFFDDDDCGSSAAASNVTLLSDVYDTTGATSLDLTYDVAYRHLASSFTVEAFDGATWQNVATYTANTTTTTEGPFNLLAYSNANFQVRYTYDDGGVWAWGVAVDNFLLEYETPSGSIPQYFLDMNGEVTVDINDLFTSVSDNCSVTVSAGSGGSTGPCDQSNPSNGFENGKSNTAALARIVAHDLTVGDGEDFTLETVSFNEFIGPATTVASVDVYVYENTGGQPGTLITSELGLVPASQTVVGGNFGFDVREVILNLTPVALAGTTGSPTTYWVGVSVLAADASNVFWENTTVSPNGLGEAYDDGLGGGFVIDPTLDGVYTFSGTCSSGGGGGGLTFTCADLGVVNVTITATDAAGNTSSCTSQIEIIDNIAPVLVTQDITVELDENGQATIVPEDLFGVSPSTFTVLTISSDNGSGAEGFTDLNVPVLADENISFDWSYTTNDGPGFDSFGYTINGVYTMLTNPGGANNQSGSAVVPLTTGQVFGFRSQSDDGFFGPATTTISNFMPGFTGQFAPANWTEVLTNSDGSATFIEIPGGSLAFDNCAITVSAVDINTFTCADIGTPVTVTVFVSDASGNIAAGTAVVTVVDLLGPVIDCPADMTVDTDAGSITYTVPDYVGDGLISVTDNCTDPVTVYSQTPAPGTLLLDGVYTVTIDAEDEYGNASTCSFQLTVDTILGLDENELNAAIIMYPNPANAYVNLRNNSAIALTEATIYDINGKLVTKVDLSQMSGEQRIDVSSLASGVYMVNISSDTATVVKRLIKK